MRKYAKLAKLKGVVRHTHSNVLQLDLLGLIRSSQGLLSADVSVASVDYLHGSRILSR